MAETVDGMDALRARVERRSRSVPPPRRPREAPTGTADLDEADQDSHGLSGGDGGPPATEAANGGGGEESRIPAPVEGADPPGAVPREPTHLERPELQAGHSRPAVGDEITMRASQPTTSASGDEPTANLTLRVRQSLDFHLAELIHELRRQGVRSSKKELIEMCLSELPGAPTEELRTRLRSYRAQLPRDL